MKKWLTGLAIGMLLLAGLAPPARAQGAKFWLQAQGDNLEAITNGRCWVLTATANTVPTIYTTTSLATAASNPVAMDSTSGVCEWFAATSVTAFDVLMFVDSGPYKGARIRVDNVTRGGQHKVMVPRQHSLKVLAIPYPSAAAATATTDSRSLPGGALVSHVILMTTTAVAGSSIALGQGAEGAEANLCNGRAPLTSTALSESSTAAVGFSQCVAAPPALGGTAFLAAASGAVRIHNQNHATSGMAFVFYHDSGNEP